LTDAYSTGDPETLKTRICSRPCSTCITLPAAQRIRVPNARAAELIRHARDNQTFIVCHATLPIVAPPGVLPAVCRGFADQYDTAALRLIRQLFGFLKVDPPEPHP
jgi:hypothetical protein